VPVKQIREAIETGDWSEVVVTEEVRVPPYLVDGPLTRKDFASYYHEVSQVDRMVGRVWEEVRAQGLEENTYFIFCADNGRPFPRCKTRLYDSGIKTPFIMVCPGGVSNRVEALVSSIDFAPTILELAGIPRCGRFQGVSLVPLLDGSKASVRDYVFSEHNWHVYSAHERMVRSGDWVYLRNAWPELQSRCVESMSGFPAGRELRAFYARGILKEEQLDVFRIPRPAEELYNVRKDPYQLKNLASVRVDVVESLRAVLDRWVVETGDSVPKRPVRTGFWRGNFPGGDCGATTVTNSGPILREQP